MGGSLKNHHDTVSKCSTTVRFLRGSLPIGFSSGKIGLSIAEHVIEADISIPTNCTSGTCGTCLVRLVSGSIELPETLPPGLDDYLVDQGGVLACCMSPTEDIVVDILPPI